MRKMRKRGDQGSLKSESSNYSGTESCRPTRALSRLGLRLGVFVGTFFDGSVGIMNLCLHSRPSGLRASRWADKEKDLL
jgi:hypothetical protein